MSKSKKRRMLPCRGGCGKQIRPHDSKSGYCFKCRYDRPQTPTSSTKETPEKKEITVDTAEECRTLEDMIRICKIDLEVWEVERWVANKWEVGMKVPAVDDGRGHWSRNIDRPVVTPLYQVKVWLRKRSLEERSIKAALDAVLADIKMEIKRKPAIVKHTFVPNDYLFEFAPFDLHMGKYTWGEETVTNYDIDIATDLFNASLDFLLSRALKLTDGHLDRVLCVFGNDVSHIDTKQATTTAGTYMDVDGRYVKVYRRICEVHRRTVDILKQVAPVDIVVIPGNHDEITAFHLGELLKARYEGDKHVYVDNSPRPRKYYEYGVNLFGFAHGHVERPSELPLCMAREEPEKWARCESREWHIGHLHKNESWSAKGRINSGHIEQDYFADKGVRIRRLTSLSGHDQWHTKNAFMDRRACEAFVFHKTAGFTDLLSFNVDHFSGKGLKV